VPRARAISARLYLGLTGFAVGAEWAGNPEHPRWSHAVYASSLLWLRDIFVTMRGNCQDLSCGKYQVMRDAKRRMNGDPICCPVTCCCRWLANSVALVHGMVELYREDACDGELLEFARPRSSFVVSL
jgi:hypothetical protein